MNRAHVIPKLVAVLLMTGTERKNMDCTQWHDVHMHFHANSTLRACDINVWIL